MYFQFIKIAGQRSVFCSVLSHTKGYQRLHTICWLLCVLFNVLNRCLIMWYDVWINLWYCQLTPKVIDIIQTVSIELHHHNYQCAVLNGCYLWVLLQTCSYYLDFLQWVCKHKNSKTERLIVEQGQMIKINSLALWERTYQIHSSVWLLAVAFMDWRLYKTVLKNCQFLLLPVGRTETH